MEIISEKLLEKKLARACLKAGWLSLKFTSPSFTGMPDRIILGMGARVKFVEVKTTGKKPTGRQQFVHRMLRKFGFEVWVVDSRESFNAFIESLHD